MKLSSVLIVCSGLINTGIAGIFYYFALISYLDNWLHGAGWQTMIGVMFTIISISSFLGSKHFDKTESATGSIALMVIAFVELLFSLPFLFFAFAGGYMSLLEYGLPFLFASVLLLVGSALEWRKIKKIEELKSKNPG